LQPFSNSEVTFGSGHLMATVFLARLLPIVGAELSDC
jgi:hypothetical protein